jgi:hypothetical protein
LKQFKSQKEEMFEKRFEIASLVSEWSLDTWLLAVLNLAGGIGRQGTNDSERHYRTESF